MNKLLLTLAMFLTAMTASAQENARSMVVHEKGGAVKTYAIQDVDSVTFGKTEVQGTVDVAVTVASTAAGKAYGTAILPSGFQNGAVALIPNDVNEADYPAYIRTHNSLQIANGAIQWAYSNLDKSAKYVVAAVAYGKGGEVVAQGSVALNFGDGSVKDLGEGANTYIVPAAGKYSFVPMHVDGSYIDNIATVDWIWSTKAGLGNKQNLISNITCEGSRVTFDATGKKGSVVLAAFDTAGKVVWTWLIWCTDQPEVMTYENGAQFMDRNLGATSANPDDGNATWGLVWQWGRPNPFFGGYDENEWAAADAFKEAKAWTVVNDKYNFSWGIKAEGTSMENAIAAPLTFFSDDASADWHLPIDLSLWATHKTNYDPSPAGYRLPSVAELAPTGSMQTSPKNKGYVYEYNGNTAWWPASGSGREFETGCNIIGNTCCYVWSGTAFYLTDFMQSCDAEPMAYRFVANNGQIYSNAPGNRAAAHAVRCVVDKK